MTQPTTSPPAARTRRTSAGRDRLSRDQLVDTAIAIADAEGLDTVTIRRLAAHHQVTPMALYWHFKDKDELLDAMTERLFADTVQPPATSRPWHEQLRALFESFLTAIRPHPELAALASTRALASAAAIDVTERTLRELRRAGFSIEQSLDIACYSLAGLIGLVTGDPCRPQGTEGNDEMIRAKKALLASLPEARYPNLLASAAAMTSPVSPESYFVTGLDLIIGGIRACAPKKANASS